MQYSYDAIGRKYTAQYGTYGSQEHELDDVQPGLTRKYVYAGGVVMGVAVFRWGRLGAFAPTRRGCGAIS